MKKIFLRIILFFIFFGNYNSTFSFENTDNIKILKENTGKDRSKNFDILEDSKFFEVGTGEKGIKNLLMIIARDLKNLVFFFVLIVGIIMVIKLIFGNNTEEESKKLKMGILWVSVGMIVMQSAFGFYNVLFNKEVSTTLANNFTKGLIEPFINLLLLLTGFIFITVGIIAFYRIITARGDEEKTKKGKMTIFYAIIGFIVIKFSHLIVKNTYNPNCGSSGSSGITIIYGSSVCENISDNAKLIVSIINWLNGFVGIITILLVIYAGFLILTSAGDEEKIKKAKSIILYIAIGILILVSSYLILTFFILPESKI